VSEGGSHADNATAEFQAILMRAPYHRWLGLQVVKVDQGQIEIAMPWREEMVSNAALGSTHGGILAALIDLTGLYAVRTAGGAVSATADLRVDYHRPAIGGSVIAHGSVVKLGRRISTADVRVTDTDNILLASGRGAYLA
jgi:uncharacterized protein (TIGR00369 family)